MYPISVNCPRSGINSRVRDNQVSSKLERASSIGALRAYNIDRPLMMFARRRSYNDVNLYNCSAIFELIALARSCSFSLLFRGEVQFNLWASV